jgi:large subunit ribosomal protein L9
MAAMEIILLKDVDHLGYADEVLKVKPGYGRNYLIPQKLAVVANVTNRKLLAERMRLRAKKEEALLSKINDIKAALEKLNIKIQAKAGANDKIFGSVSNHQIADMIKNETGYDIERRKITVVEGTVKSLGSYTAQIDLSKDHSITIPFEVIGADN